MFAEMKQAFMDGLDWLVTQLLSFLDLLFNLAVDVINLLILGFARCVDFVVALLPGSETYAAQTAPAVPGAASLVNFINWFLPVSSMAAVISIIVLNYVLYFTLGRVLKVAQII